MKRTTKLFAILLVFAVAFSCLCTMGATADEEGVFTYYIADNAAVLTDVKNTAAGEVVVPDTLGGAPVRMIDGAFRNKTRITSVVLPDSVTVIAQNSFAYCSALKTVDFGSGLISVKEAAFSGCVSLTGIEFPDTLTELGPYSFSWCEKLASVKLSNSLKIIDKGTFSGCTTLGYVEIPESVRYIRQDAFSQTKYAEDPSNWEDGMLYMGHCLLAVKTDVFGFCEIKPGTKTVADRAFSMCEQITEVAFYDDIINIGEAAFYGCKHITDVFYSGDVAKHKKLEIGKNNNYLNNALWHYYYQPGVKEYMPGDVNGDDRVNNKDLLRLMKYLSDWDVEVMETVLDVNGDGSVNNKDLTRLHQYLSGWDVKIYSLNVGYEVGGDDHGPAIGF